MVLFVITHSGIAIESSLFVKPKYYPLTCLVHGRPFEDDGFILERPHPHEISALLVASYTKKHIEPLEQCQGLFRYRLLAILSENIPTPTYLVSYSHPGGSNKRTYHRYSE